MNFYEHTLIAKQDLSTPELNNIEKKYKDIITKSDGKVIKVEKWGLLSFAKKIRSYNKGFYIHFKFEAENKTLDEIKKNGKQFRVLELVIYKADCPICGNDISVIAGKNKYKGRLIGECDESPRGHVFSFDHITKKGLFLE